MTLRSKLTARLTHNQKQAIRRLIFGDSAPESSHHQAVSAREVIEDPPTVSAPTNAAAIEAFDRQAVALDDLPHQSSNGQVDLSGLYGAFRRYRNFERASLCAEIMVSRDSSVTNHIRVARSLIDLNRPTEAIERLARLNSQSLAKEARRQVAYHSARSLRMLGRHEEALEVVSGYLQLSAGSIETRLLLIDILMDFHRHDEVHQHFQTLLTAPNPSQGVVGKHLDWLYGRNRLAELERRLTQLSATRTRAPDLAWRLSRVHWVSGNQAAFNRTTRNSTALIEQRIPPPGAIAFYTGLFPGHEGWLAPGEFQAALRNQLHQDLLPLGLGRSHGPDWALNRLQASRQVEDFDFVTEYAHYMMREFPYVPQAYTAMAEVETARGSYDSAENYLRTAAIYDKSDPALHEAKFELELLRTGDPAKLESVIEERDRHVMKFHERLPDGRQRYYDRDLHTLYKRKGDYVSCYQLHGGQIHNRYLANRYPMQYRPQDLDLFGPKKLGRVAVIGQDGVGDEVRWAQHLRYLVENAESVSLTCDPRLEKLLSRSFPSVRIRGIRRYPFYFPRVGATDRELVDQIHVSAKADNELLDELSESDRIVLPEEIAVQWWISQKKTRPSIEDRNLNGAYLIPDAELLASWKHRLQQDAGGRFTVGIAWRSEVETASRTKHFLDIGDFGALLHHDISLISLQPKLRAHEAIECINKEVHIYGDLDLYNDFDNIAACTANLDLVIGIPSVPGELASAVGTESWIIAPAPFGRYSRADPEGSGRDLMTANARIYHEQDHDYQLGRHAIIEKIMSNVRRDLIDRVSNA